MLITIVATSIFFALTSAFARTNAQIHMLDDIYTWHPPSSSDLRGPCPMMNTLANHNYIPRNGGNITKQIAVDGLQKALNFDAILAGLMWEKAIIANPVADAEFFTLDHLNRHNILEHDASLSRVDAYFGNTHHFSPSVFSQTTKFWTEEVLNAEMLTNSKLARMLESRAFNPEYTFSSTTEEFSLGEIAAPIIAFGDLEKATVERSLVVYFFENERLPIELGWQRRHETVMLKDILDVVGVIRNATSLLTMEVTGRKSVEGSTDGAADGVQVARRSLHMPMDLS